MAIKRGTTVQVNSLRVILTEYIFYIYFLLLGVLIHIANLRAATAIILKAMKAQSHRPAQALGIKMLVIPSVDNDHVVVTVEVAFQGSLGIVGKVTAITGLACRPPEGVTLGVFLAEHQQYLQFHIIWHIIQMQLFQGIFYCGKVPLFVYEWTESWTRFYFYSRKEKSLLFKA